MAGEQEQLLGVPKLAVGTGVVIAEAVIVTLYEWKLDHRVVASL